MNNEKEALTFKSSQVTSRTLTLLPFSISIVTGMSCPGM